MSLPDPRAIKAADAVADVGVGVTAKPCWELRAGAAAELPSWHQAMASAAAWHQVWGLLDVGEAAGPAALLWCSLIPCESGSDSGSSSGSVRASRGSWGSWSSASSLSLPSL